MWVTPARALLVLFLYSLSALPPLLPEAPLDGTVQLFVQRHPERHVLCFSLCAPLVRLDPLPSSEGAIWNASFHSYKISLFLLFVWLFLFFTANCAQRKSCGQSVGQSQIRHRSVGIFGPITCVFQQFAFVHFGDND